MTTPRNAYETEFRCPGCGKFGTVVNRVGRNKKGERRQRKWCYVCQVPVGTVSAAPEISQSLKAIEILNTAFQDIPPGMYEQGEGVQS